MNIITKAILASVVIALPALSGNAYSHQDSASKGGSMMDHQQMMNTHESMHENQQLMDQIMMENDADKRNKLMQQHMKGMQGQMQMMGKMMGPGDWGEMSSEAMPETMQMMNMMNMRMDMMQMMMGQMMEHQNQDSHNND